MRKSHKKLARLCQEVTQKSHTIEFTNGAENFATNNLIVGRNGNNIDGSASDLTVSANPTGGMLTLIYDGATWRSR